MTGAPAVVVIGIGNPDRGDDAAGLAVAQEVRAALLRRGAPRAGICVLERSADVVGLMEAWEGAQTAILIDAARSGAPPGHVHRIDAGRQPVPTAGLWSSTHAFGVAEAVELARELDRLPARLIAYGIEGKSFASGSGLSPEVASAVQTAAAQVVSDITGVT